MLHQLGDPEEGMLAAALAYLEDGTCANPPEPASPLSGELGLRPPDAVGRVILPNPIEREDIDAW